jgi:DNA polymerase-3 subunit alpha
MPAVAMTDHGNVFAIPSFFKEAKKYAIKPIIGCEFYTLFEEDFRVRERFPLYHMGLIAQTLEGYRNLSHLVSIAHTQGFYYKPRINWQTIAEYSKDLLCLTGCLQGYLSDMIRKGLYDEAKSGLHRLIDIFGRDRLFVEVQNHGMPEQAEILPQLFRLADEAKVPVVATNDAHYVEARDWEAQDALLCIQTASRVSDTERMRMASRQFYIKSRTEMEAIFGERPDALDNTLRVAESCDFQLPYGENHYPVFRQSAEEATLYKEDHVVHLRTLCLQGLQERYGVTYQGPDSAIETQNASSRRQKMLCERLDYELRVIESTGFLDYFLIVWDFIAWAKKHHISVGPGRGSGAGCLVAYVLHITDVDPIAFGLLFERFLNPERISPPDFDIDFCMRRREEVIDYVRQKYGPDNVANIITFGTFGAKMVLRDLCRVHDIPYAEANRMAKMVPDDLKITLEAALQKSPELQQEVRRNLVAQKIIEEGKIIEGMVRNTGSHACGILISDRPIEQHIPVCLQEGSLTTQFSMEPVGELGLLKMDFLGLKTLTVIADVERHVQVLTQQPEFHVLNIPLNDVATYALLNSGETTGIFQLESDGMRSLCRKFEISNIEEISALSALYRPGPMEWIPAYVAGKKDPSKIKYPHPLLEQICKETYGILVYQEQVMEAARVIAGYTLGGADILRRAMGKKKAEEMAKQRAVFIKGAHEHHRIAKAKAEEIFDILEKFAGYGFNKSHSTAYAIIAYQTAYLKANYPVAFMASLLSAELGNADKTAGFIAECRRMTIPILAPDINESFEDFTPNLEKCCIRFGLAAIKGVGEAASQSILSERERNGPFKNFRDFIHRIDLRVINKRVLECLIKCGTFDNWEEDRQYLLDTLDATMAEASSLQKDRDRGQSQLFDFLEEATVTAENATAHTTPNAHSAMPPHEKWRHEKELLGFYVTGHPLDLYEHILEAINSPAEHTLAEQAHLTPFRLCGILHNFQKRFTQKDQRPWASFDLETRDHVWAMNCFPDTYERIAHRLAEGNSFLVQGSIRRQNEEVRLSVTDAQILSEALPQLVQEVHWELDASATDLDAFLEALHGELQQTKGSIPVRLLFHFPDEEQVLKLPLPASSSCGFDLSRFRTLKQRFQAVKKMGITAKAVTTCAARAFSLNLHHQPW